MALAGRFAARLVFPARRGLRHGLYADARFPDSYFLVSFLVGVTGQARLVTMQKVHDSLSKLLWNPIHRIVLLIFEHDESPLRQGIHQRVDCLFQLW